MIESLRFIVRTPHEVVVDEPVRAARLPTESGQVGLRPRGEPILLAVEPGLVLFRLGGALRFVATAGGLFEGDRRCGTLYTPFAVSGQSAEDVLSVLDQTLATPDSELTARRSLGELEERIMDELRQRPRVARARQKHD